MLSEIGSRSESVNIYIVKMTNKGKYTEVKRVTKRCNHYDDDDDEDSHILIIFNHKS